MLVFIRDNPARRNRIILLTVAFLVIAWFLISARGAVFPFILGAALAYLMIPLVRFLEGQFPYSKVANRGRARLLAIITVYLALFLAVVFLISFIVPVIIRQVASFIETLPATIEEAQIALAPIAAEYQARVPPELRARVDEVIARLTVELTDALQQTALHSVLILTQTFSVLLGLAIVPVWLFYVLKDVGKGKQWLQDVLPPAVLAEGIAIAGIIDRVLSSFLRAQLFLGLVVGVITWIGLSILGIRFALVLAIIAGVTEMIPVLGPILGSIPGILVALANSPDKFPWVLLMYVLVQQAENNLLVPRVQGSAVNIHPAILMVLLVLASEVAGFWGMLFVVPMAAVSKEVFVYLYRRFTIEEIQP